MTRFAIVLGAACAACTSFKEPAASAGDAGTVSDGGASSGGTFCASKTGYDVCSDFDDGRSPSAGWERLNGPSGGAATVDSSDSHSPPSSLRFDLTGSAESNLGLVKVLGSGSVYHVEFAVRFETRVQTDYVDVARLEVEGTNGRIEFDLDMQPNGLHYEVCPADTDKCVYGDPPFDLLEWKTLAFDLDLNAGVGKLTIGDFVEQAPVVGTIEMLTVTIGPRSVAAGNKVVVRYDDVLVTHH